MTPVIFSGRRYSEQDSRPRWKRDFLARFTPPLVGINVFVLKDDYVDAQWPKVTEVQPDERWIEREYLGARKYTVTEVEADLLRSFGYLMLEDEAQLAYEGHDSRFCKRDCKDLGEHIGTGPMIMGSAMPTRNRNSFHAERERRWERDGDALKTLTAQGYNPPILDGLADLADKATSPIEIEHGRLYGSEAKNATEIDNVLKAGA